MRFTLTIGRTILTGAIAIMLAAVPAFAQNASPTPIPGPKLPPGIHFPPVRPMPPAKRPVAEPASTPVPMFPPTPAQLKFADAYVKAVNGGDAVAFRKLIAPKALACFNKKNEIFLDEWIERQLKDQIAPSYKITIEELDPTDMGKSHLFTLPVMPTHQLDISTILNGQAVTIGRPIAYHGGQWYEIAPCPTDLGVRHSILRQQHFADQQKKTEKLYNSLSPAFKKNLYQLLLQNKMAQACQQTSIQLKVDSATGCRVAQVLQTAMNQAFAKEGAPHPSAAAASSPAQTPAPKGSSPK